MLVVVAHKINNPTQWIGGHLDYMCSSFQDLLRLIEIYKKTYPNSTSEIQELMSDIELEFLVEDLPKLIDGMQMGTRRLIDIVRLLPGLIDAVLPENEQQIIADALAPYQQRGIQFHGTCFVRSVRL